jgi:hypothetical protein
MGPVPTDGFSISNLVQSLTGAGSPQLAATLSSPAVQTAIENAPTSDLVDLSSQALKLQETGLLFGNESTAETATLASILYPLASLLAAANAAARTAAESGATNPSPTATSSTASLANQLQSDLQAQEMQSLFGIAPTASPPSSLFDTLG